MGGEWERSRIAAESSAAQRVLAVLEGSYGATPPVVGSEEFRLLEGFFVQELRSAVASPDLASNITAGRLAADLLASGSFEDYVRWSIPRSRMIRDDATGTGVLGTFYREVLAQRAVSAVRAYVVRELPRLQWAANAAQRTAEWWATASPSQLSLMEGLLEALEAPDVPGSVCRFVQQNAEMVANEARGSLESSIAIGPSEVTLSLRVQGVDLAAALQPVAALIGRLMGTASWERDGESVSLSLPIPPEAENPLAREAFAAVLEWPSASQLGGIRRSLTDFLALAEYRLGRGAAPAPAHLREITEKESRLIESMQAQPVARG